MDAKSLKKKVPALVEKLLPALYRLSERIHQNPELAYEEVKASGWLADFLEERGFEVERGAGGVRTAYKAEAAGNGPGPRIAILSEYDALPEIGHACGHNLIATMGVGAAAALAQLRGELPGTVLSVGTPAEEGGGGKVRLIQAGAFDDVDAAMMIHPSFRDLPYRINLGRVRLIMEFHGKPAHASSSPERGVNALDALVAAYTNIGLLRQQLPSDCRVHGRITHGGAAVNVIHEYAAAEFFVRSRDKAFLRELVQRVSACAEGAAAAHGARVEIAEDPVSYEPMNPNLELAKLITGNLEACGGKFEEADYRNLASGSTDMGNLSWKVPSIHPYLKIAEAPVVNHTREFAEAAASERGRDLIRLGATVMAMTAVDLMADPAKMAAVRKSFEDSLAG